MKKALVVIPTYNEKDNVEPITKAVLNENCLSGFEADVHVLIVDDNSPDGTGVIADRLSSENEKVHVLHREGKEGLGVAYRAGFKWGLDGGYDYIIQMDADFSHPTSVIAQFLKVLISNEADVAVGSRYVKGGGTVNWGLGRKIISRGGSVYAMFWLGVPVWDLTGGFNAWKAEVLRKMGYDQVESNGYCYQIENKFKAHRAGFRLKEVPIVFEDRRVGESKMSGSIVSEAMARVLVLAFRDRFFPRNNNGLAKTGQSSPIEKKS